MADEAAGWADRPSRHPPSRPEAARQEAKGRCAEDPGRQTLGIREWKSGSPDDQPKGEEVCMNVIDRWINVHRQKSNVATLATLATRGNTSIISTADMSPTAGDEVATKG